MVKDVGCQSFPSLHPIAISWAWRTNVFCDLTGLPKLIDKMMSSNTGPQTPVVVRRVWPPDHRHWSLVQRLRPLNLLHQSPVSVSCHRTTGNSHRSRVSKHQTTSTGRQSKVSVKEKLKLERRRMKDREKNSLEVVLNELNQIYSVPIYRTL